MKVELAGPTRSQLTAVLGRVGVANRSYCVHLGLPIFFYIIRGTTYTGCPRSSDPILYTVCPGSSDPPERILNTFASENEVYTIY